MRVHEALGPGLLESAYAACLCHELAIDGLSCERARAIPIQYREIRLDCGFRADLVVENTVLVELKAVDSILPIHEAQVITYLKLAALPLGLLINFNARLLRDGLRRFAN